MANKPLMYKGKMVGFIQTYIPEGWGTPEFDAKFSPVIGESYLQRIRREYDPEDKAMNAPQQAPTSFPYLRVARDTGMSYAIVLWYADRHEHRAIGGMPPFPHPDGFPWSSRWELEPWATRTSAAWQMERKRRRENI